MKAVALKRLVLPAVLLALAGCATSPAPSDAGRTPSQIRAEIARRMPAGVSDRDGWANDIQVALSSQKLPASADNLCAVVAVIGQESGFVANPVVPGLGKIAHRELEKRAGAHHIPAMLVNAALRLKSPDGRSYAARIDAARTEQDLSGIFEDFAGSVPLGQKLLSGFNPVQTAGPMQVSIDFAKAHADGYPYAPEASVRQEVFSRRGGIWFGTRHLLGYPVEYDQLLYRFADFNAGQYASRNAAFQSTVARASGIELALDGDLLLPGASLEAPGTTERAVRALGTGLGMSDRQIRSALEKGNAADFSNTDLYQRVFELAERDAGHSLPRAVLPGIKLDSPKITRNLTTAWFAQRVDERWKQCMAR